ncbi:unnamed protein product [Adineta steineri]|uniref:EGF-like domain-containing protein n=1 Tax=Adineta steineri TaxID=433720 RepID=A0A818GSN6_9BILA|nr:unnamed protein product [Adineta steineri]CAF1273481.1 unnamed protein product [Adineta steineri]CAF1280067.1 unnamed protein product [Adineta steineri]CAF3493824.1 unnamed protein product [Adineta steineri]CAF3528264.1 unnamed protein product [Adineta steineri]
MTTHATMSFDSQPRHTLYSNRTYARTTTTTTTSSSHSSNDNRPFHSYLKTLPTINICENRLYDITIAGDLGSATSSSYINSSEHYDNTYINTYDNPIQYFETYPSKSLGIVNGSLNNLPHSNENFYDHAGEDDNGNCSPNTSRSTSPVLFYLENKNLAICACIISFLLLLLIGLGIFLLNKLIRPVIINTTVNNHYGIMNMTNTTTIATMISNRPIISTPMIMLLRRSSADILTTTTNTLVREDFALSCPPNRWGNACENICKPCGLGACHPTTGKCICPTDIYGEFCDLWKVNDKPKRGDMMS